MNKFLLLLCCLFFLNGCEESFYAEGTIKKRIITNNGFEQFNMILIDRGCNCSRLIKFSDYAEWSKGNIGDNVKIYFKPFKGNIIHE